MTKDEKKVATISLKEEEEIEKSVREFNLKNELRNE